MVGLSYDSPAISEDFSKRHRITFPLLSDEDSSSLQALGLVNPEGKGMTRGVAFPGILYLDREGRIVETFFEESYRDRPSPGTVLSRLFPEHRAQSVSGKHEFILGQTGEEGIIGTRWELSVTFPLPQGSHLYAPGDHNYQALSLQLEPHPWFEFGEPIYPEPKTVLLEAVREKVPTYSGTVQIIVPVTVRATEETKSLTSADKTALKGLLKYQICTSSTCLLPMETDVQWSAVVKPLNRERAPDEAQHQEKE